MLSEAISSARWSAPAAAEGAGDEQQRILTGRNGVTTSPVSQHDQEQNGVDPHAIILDEIAQA